MTVYRLPEDLDPTRLTVENPLAGVKMALPVKVSASAPDAIEWQREEPPERGKGSLRTTMIDLSGSYGFRAGGSPAGCLTAFLKLGNADAEQVAQFAKSWGVLGFCEHDLPGAHAACPPRTSRTSPDGVWYREPINHWRSYAARFEALMRESLARLSGRPIPGSTPGMMMSDRAEEIAALFLSTLLAEAGIAPRIVWNPKHRRFDFGLSLGSGGVGAMAQPRTYDGKAFAWPHGSLYPVLAVQLAAAVTGGRLSRCSECDGTFDWADAGYERLPRYDRGAYCGKWCLNESRKRQKREWARRKGAADRKEGE